MHRIGRYAYPLYKFLWVSLDWLYPPQCCGCDKRNTRLCEDCLREMSLIHPPICKCCGKMTSGYALCLQCQTTPPKYHALRSWVLYEGAIRRAIHQLKYYGDVSLGEYLARPINNLLGELNWAVDLIVPVPLTPRRSKERGYNQAALLAYPIALSRQLPYRPKSLFKTREALSQVGLTFDQRVQNVRGVFEGNPELVKGKTVLVVDDVITSGATMNECASALLGVGARRVYGVTLARARAGW